MTAAASTPEVIVPANEASWEDLQAVLGSRGYHSGCWCQRFKVRGSEWDSGATVGADRGAGAASCTGSRRPISAWCP
jgi:hypothetical protein